MNAIMRLIIFPNVVAWSVGQYVARLTHHLPTVMFWGLAAYGLALWIGHYIWPDKKRG